MLPIVRCAGIRGGEIYAKEITQFDKTLSILKFTIIITGLEHAGRGCYMARHGATTESACCSAR